MNSRRIPICVGLAWALCLVASALVRGELIRFEITSRAPYANGHSFGTVGPYEQIVGRAHYAIDPRNDSNREIVDLELGPRNAAGRVEFSSDFFILAPANREKGNQAIFYDVNNRGNKLALRFLNDASGGNDAADAGNAFLFWRGYTVVWSGWNGELLPGDGRLQLHAPVATNSGKEITGLVRYEICPQEEANRLSLVRPGHGAYPPTASGGETASLTWRLYPRDPRIPIPRNQFRIHVAKQDGISSQLPLVELELPSGFRPGYLYELIYEARNPLIHGVCFASVRDLISALRNGEGDANPFASSKQPPFKYAYGFGVSQSGRFLRELLYSGFNQDERGRTVFDGFMPHVAGAGLGSFNHRFAQPTAFSTQHEYHDWPTERFPFAYGSSQEPFTENRDGILARCEAAGTVPKILHTQSSTEYWSRAGSLVHTDPLGTVDASIPDSVRIYSFGGTQHGPASYPPEKGVGQVAANPADYRPFLRALLDRLHLWCRDGKLPPPSTYPTLVAGTLVDWGRHSTGFPMIPGTRYPNVIYTPSLLDLGSQWSAKRIIDVHPPRRRSDYTVLVPKCGPDGNELGCLLPPEVAVPLATFTGWGLRSREAGAENDLVGLNGSYIPFPVTKAQRSETGDPRPSIQERYASLDDYLRKLDDEMQRLQQTGYLLEEDRKAIRERQRTRADEVFRRVKSEE